MAEEFKLEQTEGRFKLNGKVSRIDSDNAYRMGTVKRGKNEGKEYRSLKFGVKTSDSNEIQVELFGMEKDVSKFYDNKKKKTVEIPFDQRHTKSPKGAFLVGLGVKNVTLEKDEKGKPVSKRLEAYDAVEEIFNNLEDGDDVFVTGELQFQSYENQQGQTVDKVVYSVESIGRSKKAIDFDAEDFEEINDFEQEIVMVDSFFDEDASKVFVSARTIGFADRWQEGNFTVDVSEDDELKKLGRIFMSNVEFGDSFTIYGKCLNKAVMVDAPVEEDESEDDNPFAGVGKEKPKSLNRGVREYISELQIQGVDNEKPFEKGKYTEDDFIEDTVVDNTKDTSENPFANSNDDGDDSDASDDDLPF